MSVTASKLSGLDAQLAWDGVFNDPEWMFKTGMGGMLNAAALVFSAWSLLSWPVAIALEAIIIGYALSVARTRVLDVKATLPAWNNWGDLIMSGLSWMVVQFVFHTALPLAAIALFAIGRLTGLIDMDTPGFLPFAIFGTIVFSLLALMVNLVLSYLMMNFAVEENMSAGWQLKKVIKRIVSNPRPCILAWLLGLGIQWAMLLVPLLTVVGLFFLPTTIFISQVINATLLAQAWASTES